MKQMMNRIGVALAALIVLSTLSFAQAPTPAKESKQEGTCHSSRQARIGRHQFCNEGAAGSAAWNR